MTTVETVVADALTDLEPVFVLRGQDIFAPYAVREYAAMLRSCAAGLATGGMAELSDKVREKASGCEEIASSMIAWQARHPQATKIPD